MSNIFLPLSYLLHSKNNFKLHFRFFIFLQLLHYFPVLSISFFANINPSFCICCIIQIFLLFLLLLSMHDKYFFNKLWIIFALNHTHLCHAHIANIQNNPCNHYYTDYQTDKPPFFHLLAPLYPCIIIQVYDSTAYFSIQLYL